jgi:hypothetical protein
LSLEHLLEAVYRSSTAAAPSETEGAA